MKAIVVSVGMLLIAAGCASAIHREDASVATNAVSAGHVIVPASQQDEGVVPGTEWTPDERVIAAMERQIGILFARPDSRLKGRMERRGRLPRTAPFPLTDYYVRYCGVDRDGRKLVVGKAKHVSFGNREFVLRPAVPSQERLHYKMTSVTGGGGSYVFTAVFDVGKNELVEVAYNAAL